LILPAGEKRFVL